MLNVSASNFIQRTDKDRISEEVLYNMRLVVTLNGVQTFQMNQKKVFLNMQL